MTRRSAPRLAALLVGLLLVAACTEVGGGGQPSPTDAPGAPSPISSAAVDGFDPGGCPTAEPAALAAGQTRTVTITTELGAMELKIEADLSPIAAGNFVALAECGWYDGVVFHRVVPEFVIQGGDGENGRSPNVNSALVGTGGPGYTITDELVTAPYGRGVVAMARTSQPNSVGSQFFIVLDDAAQSSLASANTYQIIGAVISGMEVADAITAAADAEIPSRPVVMTDVTVSNP